MSTFFFDPDTGVVFVNGYPPVVSTPIQIYYTEDGGESFVNVSPPLDSAETRWFVQADVLYDVQGDTIWYGTRHGRILRSIDKGKTWEIFDTGYGKFNNINSIVFKDALNGIAVVDIFENISPTHVIYTRDGGESWERIPSPSIIESLFYIEGSGEVYIGSTSFGNLPGYIVTKDGGNTWTYDLPNPPGVAFSFPAPDRGLLGAINIRGGIYRYVGPPLLADSTQKDELIFEGVGLSTLPEGYYIYDLHAVNDQVLWAVARDQTFINQTESPDHVPIALRRLDGGDTWESFGIEEAMGRISFDLYAFNEDTVWITTQNFDQGPGRGVFVSYDGGETWTEKFNDVAGGVWMHWFDRNEGIVINRQFMAKTFDGGETWQAIADSLIPTFGNREFTLIYTGENSKSMVGDHMWFGTSQGRIYRTADRGDTWEAILAIPDSVGAIMTIAFKDTLNGLAAAPFPRRDILRTTDGGETWNSLPPFPASLRSIEYVPGTENTYIAASLIEQYLAYTLDGGETWTFAKDVAEFRAIDFIDNETGWISNSTTENSVFAPILKYSGDLFPAVSTSNNRDLLKDIGVTAYPNPVVNELIIISEQPVSYIGLIDITGRTIPLSRGKEIKEWKGKMDNIQSGNYWLELHVGGNLYYKLLQVR